MKHVLSLCLWLVSMAVLASSSEPPFEKGTVLVERPDDPFSNTGSVQRISCEGRFCLWRVVDELGACTQGYCSNKLMVLSDLQGRFVGAMHGLHGWSPSVLRFIDAEHVEVVTRSRDEPATVPDVGMDPTRVYRQVLKVSRDGSRFTKVPSQAPTWTMPDARREDARAVSNPPKPRPVSDKLLAQARARCLCPEGECRKGARFTPVEYVCQGAACMLLLSAFEPSPDGQDASSAPEGSVEGPLCGVLVKGGEVQSVLIDSYPTYVVVSPGAYEVMGPVGVRGATELIRKLDRGRPGYLIFSDTVGATVEGIRPYPVRFAQSAEDALSLAPTVQAYTQAHVSWGLAGWKDADDLAFAWRLARVGEALALHVEVHDDKVVALGTGTGLHSDHLELTVWQTGASGPRAELKLGLLLVAGGTVKARDWTGNADKALPSIQGTWRKRPRGYEMTLTLSLADLGVSEPLRTLGVEVAVSDADARGKQETLMKHDGVLHFWEEYPPSVAEYDGHAPME
ncbi:hypothetical protein ACN469_36220 [Corallococcus terminator]